MWWWWLLTLDTVARPPRNYRLCLLRLLADSRSQGVQGLASVASSMPVVRKLSTGLDRACGCRRKEQYLETVWDDDLIM